MLPDSWVYADPTLVWGLFTRGVGLIYLIAFASLTVQVLPAAGEHGVLPIAGRLRAIARDFPSWRRFYWFPTLLWLSPRDLMLRALPWVGVLGALAVIWGGPHSFWALALCYVCYLSLDLVMGLIFPWDCVLFEVGLISLWLPATLPLPALEATAAPPALLCWAVRLLLFRVMFGFGKQKFVGASNKDLAYLKGFLVAQPLPSPLGWYAQKLPVPVLGSLVLLMFVAEIPVPLLFFVPGELSVIAAGFTVFLMIGILAMGSFGFFSPLTAVACIALFDNVTPQALEPSRLFDAGQPWVANGFLSLHTLCTLVVFPLNSWVGQSWTQWSIGYRLPPVLQWPLAFFRFLHPFRWLHPYGVFPPNTYPGVKMTLAVQVSWDGQQWHELPFRWSPTRAESPPRFVAPHHPRGDQALMYETFGLNPTSLVNSTLGPFDPYSYGTAPGAQTLLQRILEGHGTGFMDDALLHARGEPPKHGRIHTVMLEPLSLAEHRASGKWWRRTYIGPHTPARQLDPDFWTYLSPEPELWHYDAILWRRRSRLHALMERSRAQLSLPIEQREDPLELALLDAEGLNAEDVRRFWEELVPLVTACDRTRFESLPAAVREIEARFDRRTRHAFYRLLGRFSLLLVARLEPLYLGRGLKPELPFKTYFQMWMVVQHLIAEGEAAYLAALDDPSSVAQTIDEVTAQRGLYFLSLFRLEHMAFEAQKLRLLTCVLPPHDEALKHQVAHDVSKMGKAERTLAALAEYFSGFFAVMPFIRESFKGPEFDHGNPECYPAFTQLDSGEVVVIARRSQSESLPEPADERAPGPLSP